MKFHDKQISTIESCKYMKNEHHSLAFKFKEKKNEDKR